MSLIGTSVPRKEDGPLLTGAGRFAADISFPGQLHMRIVRSAVAHGRLLGIDTAAALSVPGVAAVWTGADVAHVPPIEFRQVRVPGLEPYRQPILAQAFARYVGEPVAAVFADDSYRAEDAAERVSVDIEELPPRLDAVRNAIDAAIVEKRYGDLDGAFAAAHSVIALELAVGRQSGTPIETRGALARFDAERDLLEVFGAAKIPHINRRAIATMLGLPLEGIHLYEGHVGGGFGVRGELYPEDVLVCLAALKLGQPIKWIEDRREHLIAANHARGQIHRLRAAFDSRGFILGLDDEFWFDQGAYARTHAATLPDLTAAMLPGPYRIPAFRARGHLCLTNKTPAGTYRAPGRFEGTFVRERLIDAIAGRLSQTPETIRRINFIAEEHMPFDRGIDALGTAVVYDSGDYAGLLDRFEAHFGIGAVQASLAARRAAGETVGYGAAFFVEKSGLGPFDGVRVTLQLDGCVEVVTGVASLGQGVETVIAQICADALGAAYDAITVVHGQTDRIADGRGAFASRVTAMTGPATHLAALKLKARILDHAARLMQCDAGTLNVNDGAIRGAGASMTFAALAGETGSLSEEEWFTSDHMNYPYGVHGAVVAVDRETGAVQVERILIGYEIGRCVNPMLVEGQLAGGAAQGIGGALHEEFLYDADGQPLAVTFADYVIPTCAEVGAIDCLIREDAPSPINPLGIKGAGEGGITAIGAAIAAAIDDALGLPGLITRLPVTPQRLLEAIARRAVTA